jgi:glycosyltransferase involved in cell wall biosynthesis
MNAADVMVLTSRTEGSPNSVKEACACNLPVVSVDTGDVRERIEGLKNCHITSHEPKAIADAVMRVLESRSRSDGRDRVLHLDKFKMAARVAQVYREVALWPA